MREHKYRVWDGEKMILDAVSQYWFGEFLSVLSNPEGERHEYEGWIPLQFTGLLDSKGKEIYEGDVVEYHGDEYKTKSIVKYLPEYGAYRLTGLDYKDSNRTMVTSICDNLEVIGDIYASPESMEQRLSIVEERQRRQLI